MSERDIYRYDIIIAVNDEDAVKRAKVAEEKLRKIFERISQHSRALNRAIGTPTINLNDNVTGQTQRIERVLSHIDSTIAEPETRLLDNTTDRITTIDSRLRNQDNITSIPEIMLEDNASNAAEGIERNLNRLNGTVVRPRVVLENESNVISTGRNATQNILAQPTDVITERNNSLASYTPRGYRAAGTKFWQNIDLDAIEDRDSVISRYHAGNLTQSQGYRAAGRYFWENVDLNRVESRDHIMALRESGDLRRYGTSRENFLPPRNRAARDENHQPLSTWGSVLPTDQSAMFGYAGRNTRPRQWGSALPTGQSRNNGSSLNNVTRNTNMPEQWGRALPTRQSRDIGYTASNTRNINSSRQWGNVLPTRQSLSVGYRGRRTRDGTNNEITSISRRIRSLNNTTANPSVVLRDTTSSGIRNITRRLNALDRTIANPEIVTRDRNTNEVVRRSQSKLRELTSRGWRVTITAVDKVSSTIDNVKSKIKTFINPITTALAATGGTAAIGIPLNLAGEMEQAQISMDFFAESPEAGKELMDKIKVFAAKTPFEFPFVRDTSTSLMGLYKGMGLNVEDSTKETMRAMRAFGDAAGYTGVGENGMSLSLLGFRQIGTIGKLQLEELRQVTENLLIPMELVRKELGLTQAEMADIGRKGIPAAEAMDAILRALENNFGGGMEKLSKSLIGLQSTIKDTARFAITAFGMGMADPIKRILLDLVGLTDYTGEGFQRFTKTLEDKGKAIGIAIENMYNKGKNFFVNIINNTEFQKLDFGDKFIFVVEAALDELSKWISGPGGDKLGEILGKIGAIAFQIWRETFKATLKAAIDSALQGNFVSAYIMGSLAMLLGGKGILGMLGKAGKGAGKLGKWLKGKFGRSPSALPEGITESSIGRTTARRRTATGASTSATRTTTRSPGFSYGRCCCCCCCCCNSPLANQSSQTSKSKRKTQSRRGTTRIGTTRIPNVSTNASRGRRIILPTTPSIERRSNTSRQWGSALSTGQNNPTGTSTSTRRATGQTRDWAVVSPDRQSSSIGYTRTRNNSATGQPRQWGIATPTRQSATVGYTGSRDTRNAANETSKAGKVLSKASKIIGKAAIPIAVASEAINVASSEDKTKAVAQSGGGLAGMWAGTASGAKLGLLIGTAIAPGVGSAIGTALGGIVGGIGGYAFGKWGAGKVVDKVRESKETTNPANPASEAVNADKTGSEPFVTKSAKNAKDVADNGGFFSNLWDDTVKSLNTNISIAKMVASKAGNWIAKKWEQNNNQIKKQWGAFSSWFNKKVWTPMMDVAISVINIIVGAFGLGKSGAKKAWGNFSTWFNKTVWNPIRRTALNVLNWIGNKFTNIKNTIIGVWNNVSGWFISTVWTPIQNYVTIITNSISNAFNIAKTAILNAWGSVGSWFNNTVWTPIKGVAQTVFSFISNGFNAAKQLVIGVWSGVSGWFLNTVWNPIITTAKSVGSWIESVFDNAKTTLITTWTNVATWLDTNVWQPIKKAITDIYNLAPPFVQKVLGILNSFGKKGSEETGLKTSEGKSSILEHAKGGILTKPHIGLVAEDGAEAIIPLNPKRRTRGLELWEKAGKLLGVEAHANGGIFGSISDNNNSYGSKLSNTKIINFNDIHRLKKQNVYTNKSVLQNLITKNLFTKNQESINNNYSNSFDNINNLTNESNQFGNIISFPQIEALQKDILFEKPQYKRDYKYNSQSEPITASSPYVQNSNNKNNTGYNVSINGINVYISKEEQQMDEDALAMKIGQKILASIKQKIENTA